MKPKFLSALLLVAAASAAHAQEAPPISLTVDASEASRGIFHSRLSIPARPGPITLVYPEWIPGHHRSAGPINSVVGLKVSASNATLPWRRDDVDMFAIHVDVPANATSIDVAFDTVSPTSSNSLSMITWNELLMYPLGKNTDDIPFAATLKLPPSWKYGTSLQKASDSPAGTAFKPLPLTYLIDSPVITGEHFRAVPIPAAGAQTHFIDMVGESDAVIDMKPETAAQYSNLVAECTALFGARHYDTYHWLLTVNVPGGGLEHHESSDDRVEEDALATDAGKFRLGGLLAHEYIHSWNGKFRRPAGLATPDYQKPMKGELLWVYEGLTDYLAAVVCPRAGLISADGFHEKLADTAAGMDYTMGRQWRPLIDTTIAAPILYSSPGPWRDYRRSTDFYPEGILLWLEIDTMIRQQTQNKKSINDFCLKFHGGPSKGPELKPYDMAEVVGDLNEIAPYDWKKFLDARLNSTDAHAPLGGIANAGWKLIYNDTPGDDLKYRESQTKTVNLMYSLGIVIGSDDGTVRDIVPGLPADKAGISPGMKLVAVNGRKWSADLLKSAVKNSKAATTPIELLISNNDFFKTCTLNYHDGARYPRLERDPSKPDLLAEIAKPLAPAPK
jgi:predicted metalloprotease with PDZ domain